jgi:hypothetical protein
MVGGQNSSAAAPDGATTPARSKRKVKTVNYSDDNAFDQMQERANEAAALAATKPATRRGGAPKGSRAVRRDVDLEDVEVSFPMNWQRKIPAGERLSSVMDFEDAVLKDDGKLYLRDGSTMGPDGKCIISFVLRADLAKTHTSILGLPFSPCMVRKSGRPKHGIIN